MALLTNPSGTFILAANFGQGNDIEVYNTSFAPAKLTGNFTDPNLPANYAPFSVHVIGNQVFVTYALQTVSSAAAPAPTSPAPTTPAPTNPTPTNPLNPIGYVSGVSPHTSGISYVQTVGPSNGIVDVFDPTATSLLAPSPVAISTHHGE